ncbi:hypothetical protein BH09BAC5_BH09BAC5_08960 [soil metagenome]
MRKKLLFILLTALPFCANAQLGFMLSVEGGFAGSTVNSKQIPAFLAGYNLNNAAPEFTQPFKEKNGLAKGRYLGFTLGMGGAECKMALIIDFYKMSTPKNEARFSNGYGRNVWTEIKETSSEVGVNFYQGKFVAGFEFVISLRTNSIYSEYVFPDGSTSMGNDHSLNGIYSDLTFGPGIGINVGYKILPFLVATAKSDYIFGVSGQHPEYHQYSDLQNFKTIENLPQTYTTSPGSGNAVYNDIKGLRFSFGLTFLLTTDDKE